MNDATVQSIVLAATADNYSIRNNWIRDCSGNGIEIISGVTGTSVVHNEVSNPGGTDYVNAAGTGAAFRDNYPYYGEVFYVKTNGTQNIPSSGEAVITQLAALAFPSGGGNAPDGLAEYLIWAAILQASYHFNSSVIRARMGPLGTTADPEVIQWQGSGVITHVAQGWPVVPSPGDKLTFTCASIVYNSTNSAPKINSKFGATGPGTESNVTIIRSKES